MTASIPLQMRTNTACASTLSELNGLSLCSSQVQRRITMMLPELNSSSVLLWSGRWDSNPLSAKATDLQSAPTLQLRRSPIIYEGNIRQHLLRFTLQIWQENDLNLLSLRLIPFIKHGFVFTVRCQQQ